MINKDPRVFQKIAGIWNELLLELSVVEDDGLIFKTGDKVIWCVDVEEFIGMTEAEVIKKLKENGLEFRIR